MLADLVLIACIALVSAGAGLIFLPAGLIAAGLLGGAATILYARGSRDRAPDRPGT